MVRKLRPSDIPTLQSIHAASGLDYRFPDLNNALFFVQNVYEVEGIVKSALVLRLNAEAMLITSGTPQQKMLAMRELQAATLDAAYVQGFDEIEAAIPDSIRFNRRLHGLGWLKARPGWSIWSRSTHPAQRISDAERAVASKLGV